MHKQPDSNNFLRLILDNKGIIIKICNSYCNNRGDREDLAQEIIYALWKGRTTFNPEFKFSTWMYRVALNVAISFYRSGRPRRNDVYLSDVVIEVADDPPEQDNNMNVLMAQVAALKELDKALIILYFEGKSYREIAEIMGISETNVATKLSRIREKLKAEISRIK
jgi:RNA polymerase sigma-70 factor (ECF subfamily)